VEQLAMKDDKPSARATRDRNASGRRERADAGVEAAKERVGTHGAAAAGGAVAGAVAGAASGLAAGPVGSVVGAVTGALAGVAAGAATGPGERWNLGAFEQPWRRDFLHRAYVRPGHGYEHWSPAYRFAIEQYAMTDHPQRWDEVEQTLARRWLAQEPRPSLDWPTARAAVRDAWCRMYDPEGWDTGIYERDAETA
jgi:hypothetical protein